MNDLDLHKVCEWLDDFSCDHPWVSEDGATQRHLGMGWCKDCDRDVVKPVEALIVAVERVTALADEWERYADRAQTSAVRVTYLSAAADLRAALAAPDNHNKETTT